MSFKKLLRDIIVGGHILIYKIRHIETLSQRFTFTNLSSYSIYENLSSHTQNILVIILHNTSHNLHNYSAMLFILDIVYIYLYICIVYRVSHNHRMSF